MSPSVVTGSSSIGSSLKSASVNHPKKAYPALVGCFKTSGNTLLL